MSAMHNCQCLSEALHRHGFTSEDTAFLDAFAAHPPSETQRRGGPMAQGFMDWPGLSPRSRSFEMGR